MAKGKIIGTKIREARKRVGLSQEAVAKSARLQRCQVSDLERGILNLEHVHWGTIQRLCQTLHLAFDELSERA